VAAPQKNIATDQDATPMASSRVRETRSTSIPAGNVKTTPVSATTEASTPALVLPI
jgi:hypothetical protein